MWQEKTITKNVATFSGFFIWNREINRNVCAEFFKIDLNLFTEYFSVTFMLVKEIVQLLIKKVKFSNCNEIFDTITFVLPILDN